MASVRFEVLHIFAASTRVIWDELVDWNGSTVEPAGDGLGLHWFEDVTPQFVDPVLGRAGAAGFGAGMRGLLRLLALSGPNDAAPAGWLR